MGAMVAAIGVGAKNYYRLTKMVDRVSAKRRSAIMARVKTKNTGPELAVRRLLHGFGYRFRLHRSDLPGSPDLAFPGRKKVVFVHGCFWHGHNCRWGRLPKSKLRYWAPKIESNRARDRANASALRRSGWRMSVVWQCELKKLPALKQKLVEFLGNR